MPTSRAFVLIAALTAAACGGGGSGGGGSPPSPPPPPAPVSISVASSSLDTTAREDAQATLTVEFAQSGTASGPVVPDLSFDTSVLTLQTPVALDAGRYRLTFRSRSDLPIGASGGLIRFRLCQEAACTNVYPNTTQTLPFRVSLVLNDWATLQRNAAHTGHVRLTVQPSSIAKIWETYAEPEGGGYVGFSRVAADATRAYLTLHYYPGGAGLVAYTAAIDVRTGEPMWNTLLRPMFYIGDPAIAGGKVWLAPTNDNGVNPMKVFDAATGAVSDFGAFDSQAAEVGAPTPIGNEVYIAPGYFAADVYSFDQTSGALRWRTRAPGDRHAHLETPAADADQVYHYTGTTLNTYRRSDGQLVSSIADPHVANPSNRTYPGAPIVLPDKTVLAYSGPTESTRYLSTYVRLHRPIVRFVPATNSIAWRTADTYIAWPAVRGDLVFTARNSPMRLDAINISDGSVAWSWTPPDGIEFVANIVVTENVLFVSTNTTTYGIDLATRAVVWTYPRPGYLAIAPGNLLLISEMTGGPGGPILGSSARLSAFRLTAPAEAGLSPAALPDATAAGSFKLHRIEIPGG
jgi:outer membrane protein assembly factor BamB